MARAENSSNASTGCVKLCLHLNYDRSLADLAGLSSCVGRTWAAGLERLGRAAHPRVPAETPGTSKPPSTSSFSGSPSLRRTYLARRNERAGRSCTIGGPL